MESISSIVLVWVSNLFNFGKTPLLLGLNFEKHVRALRSDTNCWEFTLPDYKN